MAKYKTNIQNVLNCDQYYDFEINHSHRYL